MNFELLVLAFRLDDEESVIEQEQLQIGIISL